MKIHKLYKYLMSITEIIYKNLMNFKGVYKFIVMLGIQRSATVPLT